MAEELKTQRCFSCKRERTGKERTRMVFSSATGLYYCGPHDRQCAKIRRRLLRTGSVMLTAENADVQSRMKRRAGS